MNKNIETKYAHRAKTLKALAHPTRLFIIEMLADGERCVQDITEMVGVDISTISRHLSVLKNSELVATNKRGLKVFYSLRIPCILDFFACFEKALDPSGSPCGCNEELSKESSSSETSDISQREDKEL